MTQFFGLVYPRQFERWQQLGVEEKAAWLLDDAVWGKGKSQQMVQLSDDGLSQQFAPHCHVQQFLLRLWRARDGVVAGQ